MKIVREKLNEVRGNSLTNDGFFVNIESATKSNSNFRKVLYTAKNIQLVLMTLKPGEDIELEESKKALHQALNKLPEKQNIALRLNNFEDLSYKEIAEVMEISTSEVGVLINRGKKKLKNIILEYYQNN